MLDIATLCERAGISQPTFYRMARNDPEFREFLEPRKHKPRRGAVTYDDDVLDWFIARQGVATPPQTPADEPQPKEPVITPPISNKPAEADFEPLTAPADDTYTPRGSSAETITVSVSPQEAAGGVLDATPVITQDDEKTRLQAEIESLRARLAKKESDYDELMRQNGQILMLFGAEKAEKQQLLADGRRNEPAEDPRRGLGERLRILFKGK